MNHRAIWLTAAVLAVVVLLAQVAGAATREMPASLPASASVTSDLTATTPTVTLPEQASSVATDKSATGVAAANEAITSNGPATTTTTARVNKAPAAAAPVDASTGARPGWGCGDTNHTHSGPPGRPDATPPPGCPTQP
jgi:hypothetical protein